MVDADKVHGAARSIGPIDRPASQRADIPAAPGTPSFDTVLRETLAKQPVRFSAHAQDRLRARDITFTPEAEERLQDAVAAAAEKSARDTLVLLDGVGLVVNVPNRVVVTALDANTRQATVVTNIDSAVIAPSGPQPQEQMETNIPQL